MAVAAEARAAAALPTSSRASRSVSISTAAAPVIEVWPSASWVIAP
jgi:hypothetical protein